MISLIFTSKRIDELLADATNRLGSSGSSSPALDAQVLLSYVLEKPRSYLIAWPEKELDTAQLKSFSELLARRIQGEPVAYLLGEREFWSLPLKVSDATLIPRPDTECMVEEALQKIAALDRQNDECVAKNDLLDRPHLLDLGTGTGAIALALATECPNHQVIGIDLSLNAKELAEFNAQKCAINNAKFIQGSWFEPLKTEEFNQQKFACIVSNPPYIDENDPHLSQGDVRFEPRTALVADNNGLADIQLIIEQARSFLVEQGWLFIEHGFEQGDSVRQIFKTFGYESIETKQDLGNNDRFTFGCYTP